MIKTVGFSPAHNRWWRILVVALLMYVVSMIDRTNIAMAIPEMRADLGISPAGIGFASGTFFFGYVVLQIPAGRLASVWSAKYVIFWLMILWGLVSASTALVHTVPELVANRFLLGVVEGGVLTATIVLIGHWFTREERARANMIFLLSLPLGSVIGSPISGVVLKHFDWHVMFVLEAIPALLWAGVWLLAVDDHPGQAKWLPAAERATLVARLAAEQEEAAPATQGHWARVIWNPVVLLIAGYNFLALMANWGVTIWLPSVLKSAGLSIVSVGFLAAIPYAAGAMMMVVVAFSSDRWKERKWHVIIMTSLSGAFLLAAQITGETQIMLTLLALTLSFGFFYGRFGPFWALPTEVLPPEVAGVGIAVINGLGNLGGFSGPLVFGLIRGATGSFVLALSLSGVLLVAAGLLLALMPSMRPRRWQPSARVRPPERKERAW